MSPFFFHFGFTSEAALGEVLANNCLISFSSLDAWPFNFLIFFSFFKFWFTKVHTAAAYGFFGPHRDYENLNSGNGL